MSRLMLQNKDTRSYGSWERAESAAIRVAPDLDFVIVTEVGRFIPLFLLRGDSTHRGATLAYRGFHVWG